APDCKPEPGPRPEPGPEPEAADRRPESLCAPGSTRMTSSSVPKARLAASTSVGCTSHRSEQANGNCNQQSGPCRHPGESQVQPLCFSVCQGQYSDSG